MNITIERAIEILTYAHNQRVISIDQDRKDAMKLLIEAGKTVRKWREEHRDLGFLLLPGETKEGS